MNTDFNPAVSKPYLQTAAQRQLQKGVVRSITEYSPLELEGLNFKVKVEVESEKDEPILLKIASPCGQKLGHYPILADNMLGDFKLAS